VDCTKAGGRGEASFWRQHRARTPVPGGVQGLHGRCRLRIERAVHYMLTQGAPCFLPTSIRSPTIRQITFGGIHVCLCSPGRGFSVQSVAGDSALLADVACGRLGLFGRGGAGLYRRCVQAVQRGDSRRQPRHGLHGQEAIPAQSGLPGLLPARSPGCRGKTAPHQAVAWANAAQTQETPGLGGVDTYRSHKTMAARVTTAR
jgi:hypothetical protein